MDKVRFVVCGTGGRGSGLTRAVLAKLEDVEIIGLADPYIDKAETLRETLKDKIPNIPAVYDNHIKMFDELKTGSSPFTYSLADKIKSAAKIMLITGIIGYIITTNNSNIRTPKFFKC